MSLGDRLGFAGLIVAIIGIALVYLWPDKRWIGWLCLILVVPLTLAWITLEMRQASWNLDKSLLAYIGTGGLTGALIGSFIATLVWFYLSRASASLPESHPKAGIIIQGPGPSSAKTSDILSAHDRALHVAIQQSPIEGLSQLGWTVKPQKDDTQFEVANEALPEMHESAKYLRQLRTPFTIHLQNVKGIDGLRFIKGSHCKKIEISAGEFTDLSDLRDLDGLTCLIISQTPFNGLTTVDISPLASLSTLRTLSLGMSKVTDLRPMVRPRNWWVTDGLRSGSERGSGGVCGRWSRRNAVPARSRSEPGDLRPGVRRHGEGGQPQPFLEKGRSADPG